MEHHEHPEERIRRFERSAQRWRLTSLALTLALVSCIAIGCTFGIFLALQAREPDDGLIERFERAQEELWETEQSRREAEAALKRSEAERAKLQAELAKHVGNPKGPPGDEDLITAVLKLGGQIQRAPWSKERAVWLVDLKGTPISDADLAALGAMAGVTDLDLSFTRITDKVIATLVGHKDLRTLSLAGTKVSDAAIDDLRKIPMLDTINLGATAVTPKGIARLVEGQSCTVCSLARGDKARFRVFQHFRAGVLQHSYLMINDTYYGRYYAGTVSDPPGTPPQDYRRLATTYYHRHGPVGAVMTKLDSFAPAGLLDYPSDARLPTSLMGLLSGSDPRNSLAALVSEPAIGVVRLNVGTHAAYGRPFQQMHFYNSSPELEEFSLPLPASRRTSEARIPRARV